MIHHTVNEQKHAKLYINYCLSGHDLVAEFGSL